MIIKKYKLFTEKNIQNNAMYNIIPKSILKLHDIFIKSGKKLYIVGGAVRDFLNGRDPKDFDLATNATPDDIIDIIGDTYRTNLQGKAFGVVVVHTSDQPDGIEIATFRSDIYDGKLGDTRLPDVKFTTIEDDVNRRDLTINALFYDIAKKEIVDLVGGVDDIKNHTIRMVGEPNLRIKEDPLRILRILRFAYRYKYNIHDVTSKAILENKKSLSIISKERIWEEIRKAFSYNQNDFSHYLNYITEYKMWGDIFPHSDINTEIVDSDNLIYYIANLFRNQKLEGHYNKMINNYKIESSTVKRSFFLIKLLDLNINNAIDLYKMKNQYHVTDDLIRGWLEMNSVTDSIYTAFLEYQPSVDAHDLMGKGFKGRELGKKIREMETEKFKELL